MYQQQNHPIDDILREHIHGVPVPTPTTRPKPGKKKVLKQELARFGYYYKDNGEIVYSEKQKVKNKAERARQFNVRTRRGLDSEYSGTLIGSLS